MNLPDSSILTNIHFPGFENPGNDLFEKIYVSVRTIENRLYADHEVEYLPEIAKGHSHYREWMIRKKSSRRLFNYLSSKRRRLRILEVGCGNGWLAHLLGQIPGAEISGLDINFTELQQAARVFNEDQHLRFIYGDIYSGVLTRLRFDTIVFSDSIQYFQSFGKIINL